VSAIIPPSAALGRETGLESLLLRVASVHRLPRVESSRPSPPQIPREHGLAHPADTSRANLELAQEVAFQPLFLFG
jgi:hypothetical protein